jgi:hypothetical protein
MVTFCCSITEPESEFIEEVKSGPINQSPGICSIFGAEKDGSGKEPLKTLNQSPVIPAILGQTKEVEHFGRCGKMNHTVLLAEGQRGNPDRDEPILAERNAEVGMGDDVEKELSISSLVSKLVFGKRTEGNSAKDKRAGVKSKFLTTARTLLTDEAD